MNCTIKQYLSYGGGVNSTAMLLLLHDEGLEFESIYVDHGCDWPETKEYVQMIAKKYSITVLTPQVEGYANLYEYADHYKIIPSRRQRWCTHKFKVAVINAYLDKPCFSLIGFSTDEVHRAKLSYEDGIENRFPLLEREIDRQQCEEIIREHGLSVPIKSGCWFCPFQTIGQWKKLRRIHPDLYCKAKGLEDQEIERRLKAGKKPIYLNKRPLDMVVKESQDVMFEDMKPPCHCGL